MRYFKLSGKEREKKTLKHRTSLKCYINLLSISPNWTRLIGKPHCYKASKVTKARKLVPIIVVNLRRLLVIDTAVSYASAKEAPNKEGKEKQMEKCSSFCQNVKPSLGAMNLSVQLMKVCTTHQQRRGIN